jgi:uncharacterized protein (UPF0262 family)
VSGFAETDRIARVELVEDRPRARTPAIQQELDVAIHDLTEENAFRPAIEGAPPGPYTLRIGMAGKLLALEIATQDGAAAQTLQLSISPLRPVIKDYFAICESYFDAVKRLPPDRIEAIDMGRRGIHDEGARLLSERLEGRVETDHPTARRLFTVICALQYRG